MQKKTIVNILKIEISTNLFKIVVGYLKYLNTIYWYLMSSCFM